MHGGIADGLGCGLFGGHGNGFGGGSTLYTGGGSGNGGHLTGDPYLMYTRSISYEARDTQLLMLSTHRGATDSLPSLFAVGLRGDWRICISVWALPVSMLFILYHGLRGTLIGVPIPKELFFECTVLPEHVLDVVDGHGVFDAFITDMTKLDARIDGDALHKIKVALEEALAEHTDS